MNKKFSGPGLSGDEPLSPEHTEVINLVVGHNRRAEPPARTAPKRDPAKTAAGKIVFRHVLETRSLTGLEPEQIAAACYYLDGVLFLPTGGAKVSRMFREKAKTLGIL